jgi:hypothetical protein
VPAQRDRSGGGRAERKTYRGRARKAARMSAAPSTASTRQADGAKGQIGNLAAQPGPWRPRCRPVVARPPSPDWAAAVQYESGQRQRRGGTRPSSIRRSRFASIETRRSTGSSRASLPRRRRRRTKKTEVKPIRITPRRCP